jgi:hypothetical protein
MSSVSIRDYTACFSDEVFGLTKAYPVYKKKKTKEVPWYGQVEFTYTYTTTKDGERVMTKSSDKTKYHKEVITRISDGHIYEDVFKSYGENYGNNEEEIHYRDGKLHAENTYAVKEIRCNGAEFSYSYYYNGVLHNLEGPATITEDTIEDTCYVSYYIYGKRYDKKAYKAKVKDIKENGVKEEDIYDDEKYMECLENDIHELFNSMK